MKRCPINIKWWWSFTGGDDDDVECWLIFASRSGVPRQTIRVISPDQSHRWDWSRAINRWFHKSSVHLHMIVLNCIYCRPVCQSSKITWSVIRIALLLLLSLSASDLFGLWTRVAVRLACGAVNNWWGMSELRSIDSLSIVTRWMSSYFFLVFLSFCCARFLGHA